MTLFLRPENRRFLTILTKISGFFRVFGPPEVEKCHFLAKKVEIRVFGGSKMTHFLAKKWSKNGSFLTSFLNRSPAKIAVKRPMFLSVCVQKVNQKWSKKWTKNWPKNDPKNGHFWGTPKMNKMSSFEKSKSPTRHFWTTFFGPKMAIF